MGESVPEGLWRYSGSPVESRGASTTKYLSLPTSACLLAASISAALLLISCATPYQPKGFSGGYTDFETQPGIYFVSFRDNGYTSRDIVIRYWHQRAAEICGGRQGYEIISSDALTTQHIGGTKGSLTTVHKSSKEGYIRCLNSEPLRGP